MNEHQNINLNMQNTSKFARKLTEGYKMVDTSHIDLLSLLTSDTPLKRVAGTCGGEWQGPCPFCGGKDRLYVHPFYKGGGRWRCRHCERAGDAIAYLMQRDGVSFKEACGALALEFAARVPKQDPAPRLQPAVRLERDWIALNDDDWSGCAAAFVKQSVAALYGTDPRGMKYWRSRGLSDAVVKEHELGYNPQDLWAQWGGSKVWLPRGYVIPRWIEGRYWNIRIRRPDGDLNEGDSKYVSPAGVANGLFRADSLFFGCTAVLCEGEVDALSILVGVPKLAWNRNLVPVATGSTTGARTADSLLKLRKADRILVAFDADASGEQHASWWLDKCNGRAVRLRPTHHDINEMLQLGVDIDAWLRGVL